jgi:pilus assembly protein CpaE
VTGVAGAGPVVVVAGACGGCGASLVAGALALRWAREAPTWLVDLDLDGGDLAGAWDVSADRTLGDLAAVARELEPAHLHSAAFPHGSGVLLLAAPGVGGAGGDWDDDAVARLVAAARDDGRVVVDAGRGLSRAAVAAIARADALLLACPPRLAGARRARALLDALDWRRIATPARLVVIDEPGRPEIGARALGRALGVERVHALPWSEGEARRLGAGCWDGGRRRRLRSGVSALAEALA